MIFMEPLPSAAPEPCTTNPTEMDIYLTSADIQTSQLDIYLGNLDIHRIQPTLYHEPKERVSYQHHQHHYQHHHPQLVRQASAPASFSQVGSSSTTSLPRRPSSTAPQLTRGQSWESSGYPDSESHPGSVVSTSDGSEALWDMFSSDDDEVRRKIER